MWRAFFLAIGITLCMLGAECMVIEKFVFAKAQASSPANANSQPKQSSAAQKEPKTITPPEWAPWSLLSSGAVIILYSFTIPRRAANP